MNSHQEITYTDERLADGTVYRRYGDGRQEWRVRRGQHWVEWRDDRGLTGTDELLGRRIVKRTLTNGHARGGHPIVRYARDIGYGRTVWRQHPNDPRPLFASSPPAPLVVTVNRSAFGGRVGSVLAGVGASVLLGSIIAPPLLLSAAEEEELRRALEQQAASGSGGGDGGSLWDDGGGDGSDDFG
ncbi:hypothetical protein I6A84_07920 [Frankia sp. CNm7]|uniref:Uncharacterized protein n=1 Tax=Frankia nepalensis TaxID=1836974 RepID=A0A937R9P6_9ACTN|nr:hypothetical protein [Frankia nepalensis]MBL7497832.1 hypothetical protein [Frankia nepalensis]MBL7516453.1 hypothetical protein [Frankia nepalensis]MBL7518048.1 hypothetical protein [Frankia nepalensis]MBL7625707.1 hypothetical protein [Frankia nepalensis]